VYYESVTWLFMSYNSPEWHKEDNGTRHNRYSNWGPFECAEKSHAGMLVVASILFRYLLSANYGQWRMQFSLLLI